KSLYRILWRASRTTGRPTGRWAAPYHRMRGHPWNQAWGSRWSRHRADRSKAREIRAGRNIGKTPDFSGVGPWEWPWGSPWGSPPEQQLAVPRALPPFPYGDPSSILQHALDMGGYILFPRSAPGPFITGTKLARHFGNRVSK